MIAKFTDKELIFIYAKLDFEPGNQTYYKIEKKIRKQVKRYRDHDKRFKRNSP